MFVLRCILAGTMGARVSQVANPLEALKEGVLVAVTIEGVTAGLLIHAIIKNTFHYVVQQVLTRRKRF